MADFDFDFNFDEELTSKPKKEEQVEEIKKEEPKIEEEKPKKLHPIFDQTLEEFHKKRDKIIEFLNRPDIMYKYRLNYYKIGETGLVVYQGTRGNDLAWFRWKRYDVFKQVSIRKLFFKELGESTFDLETG